MWYCFVSKLLHTIRTWMMIEYGTKNVLKHCTSYTPIANFQSYLCLASALWQCDRLRSLKACESSHPLIWLQKCFFNQAMNILLLVVGIIRKLPLLGPESVNDHQISHLNVDAIPLKVNWPKHLFETSKPVGPLIWIGMI